jgi:hypothetical protein
LPGKKGESEFGEDLGWPPAFAKFATASRPERAPAAMRGVPMAVIARQLGHSDTRVTERHYAHLALNYVADTIRANFPRLTTPDARVVPIRRLPKSSSNPA